MSIIKGNILINKAIAVIEKDIRIANIDIKTAKKVKIKLFNWN